MRLSLYTHAERTPIGLDPVGVLRVNAALGIWSTVLAPRPLALNMGGWPVGCQCRFGWTCRCTSDQRASRQPNRLHAQQLQQQQRQGRGHAAAAMALFSLPAMHLQARKATAGSLERFWGRFRPAAVPAHRRGPGAVVRLAVRRSGPANGGDSILALYRPA